MPAMRKTPERKAPERGLPKSGPTGATRAWAEDWIIRAARDRYPSGFERGSEQELIAVGTILLELGDDPNAILRAAAAAALEARCGKNGPPSPRGRKADCAANRRQERGERMVRIVAEMSEAAAGTRGLSETDRLEEMALAAAGELARHFAGSHEDSTGEKASEGALAFWWTRALDVSRDWIAAHPALTRALLDRPFDSDLTPRTRGAHEEAAMALLEDLVPLDFADVPCLTDKLRSARTSIGRRSREARREVSAARAVLKIE